MCILSQTKNLVSIYQKLFNLVLKKYKAEGKTGENMNINIRKCSGVKAFKKLLIEHPKFQSTMLDMFQSGELLEGLIKWKGIHSNMAIALKYFQRLILIIRNPEVENMSWTYGNVPDMDQEDEMEKSRTNASTQEIIFSQQTQIKQYPSGLKEIYIFKEDSESQTASETPQYAINTQMQDIEITKTGSHSIAIVKIADPFQKMEQMYNSDQFLDFFKSC